MRVDLHFHLLPGVDDGPPSMADAIELARLAVADGIASVTATPHVRRVAVDELDGRVEELRAELRCAGVPLTVECGGEVAPGDVDTLTQSELDMLAAGPADARYVLLEAPLWDSPDSLHDAASTLRSRGFGVLVAHPERCPGLFEHGCAGLHRELDAGSRLQVSTSSLLGRHGGQARLNAEAIVRRGFATVLASDAHRPSRPPTLGAGVTAAAALGVTDPERLVAEAPVRLRRDGIVTPLSAPAPASAAMDPARLCAASVAA